MEHAENVERSSRLYKKMSWGRTRPNIHRGGLALLHMACNRVVLMVTASKKCARDEENRSFALQSYCRGSWSDIRQILKGALTEVTRQRDKLQDVRSAENCPLTAGNASKS